MYRKSLIGITSHNVTFVTYQRETCTSGVVSDQRFQLYLDFLDGFHTEYNAPSIFWLQCYQALFSLVDLKTIILNSTVRSTRSLLKRTETNPTAFSPRFGMYWMMHGIHFQTIWNSSSAYILCCPGSVLNCRRRCQIHY